MSRLGRVAGVLALALAVVGAEAPGVGAQDSIEIRADGPDSVDSAAGADNVRMERNPGNQQANAADGTGNQEVRRAPREERDRGRNRDRSGRGGDGGGEAAPVEGYGEGIAAAPEPAAAQDAAAGGSATRPVQLPSTGAGAVAGVAGLAGAALAALLAAGIGAVGLNRRRPR